MQQLLAYRKMLSMPLVPELYVSNLTESPAFYVGLLGFSIDYQRPEEGFAALQLEDSRLMLEHFDKYQAASEAEFRQGKWRTGQLEYPLGRGINLEFTLKTITPAYRNLKAATYPFKLDLYEKQYRVGDSHVQVKQFLVMDPDGYLIRFAQRIDGKALKKGSSVMQTSL